MFNALIIIGIAMLLFFPFMLIRNEWVCRERIKMIESDFETYKKLPSYYVMLNKFWIWDINKFL